MVNRFLKLRNKSNGVVEKRTGLQTADNVEILSGVEAIKRRVSYYLGSSDSDALFQIFKEPFDNSGDENNEGRNSFIGVQIDPGNQITIWDKGGGIPIDIHPQTKNPILVDLFTKLHSGGKLGGGAYSGAKGTAGTHGVGVKATNALSKSLEVWTYQNGHWYNVAFEDGDLVRKLNKTTPIPKLPVKIEHGTIIRFTPNLKRFDEGSVLSIKRIKSYCQLQAFIHPGLKIFLKTPKNEYDFHEKEGLKALLEKQILDLGDEVEELGKPFVLSKGLVDIAISWTKYSGELITSYVSGSNTKDGGSHVNGLNDAIRDALKPFKGKKEFTPAEARDGIVGTINVAVIQPKFSSQDKRELKDERVTKEVYDILKPALDDYFEKNKSLVKIILAKAEELHKRTAKFTLDKKNIAQLKSKSAAFAMSKKFHNCRTKDVSIRELFLVEGDSAGGNALVARDKEYQMVLYLRGKVINAYTSDQVKVFGNSEVQDILRAVGFDGDDKEDVINKLKTNKIIVLTDPDIDGYHITNLLLSLFQKIMPEVFGNKNVYVVDGPLFRCQLSNGTNIFGASVEEVENKVKALKKKMPPEGVQRIKGWGEIPPAVLELIAFNKKTRKLACVKGPKNHEEENEFAAIVGEDSGERQKLLGV